MSNFALGYPNAVLLGALSVTASAAGLGVNQLQSDQGNAATALQIPSTSGTITVTYTGTYRAFGLFRTNLTSSATVTFAVLNGVTTLYTGVASAVVPGFAQAVLVAPQDYAGTKVTMAISDPTNPDGFLNIPLAFAGPIFQPIRNMNYSSVPGRSAQTTKATTRSGGVIVRNDWVKRTYDLSLSALRATEIPSVETIDVAGRRGNNILFVPDPASATINREALMGEFEPASGFTYPNSSAVARGYAATITERL